MSVNTTFKETREEAKEHVKKAHECLLVMLSPDTWGHDDYEDHYIFELHEMALSLLRLHKKL